MERFSALEIDDDDDDDDMEIPEVTNQKEDSDEEQHRDSGGCRTKFLPRDNLIETGKASTELY